MIISELAASFGYECLQDQFADTTAESGYTSDLMSDVMANGTGKSVLITIQAHKNAVAVCAMADISALIICNNRPIPADMLEAARTQEIGVFLTGKDQFTVSGEVYGALGLAPGS
ncbi:MAG: hypothetical protein ACOCYG_09500 [Spirochaetota bacterium]